jgi:hypothetical protein
MLIGLTLELIVFDGLRALFDDDQGFLAAF